MAKFTMGSGLIIKKMVLVKYIILLANILKVSLNLGKKTDMGICFMKMEKFIVDNGLIMFKMVKEFIKIMMELKLKVFGKMVNFFKILFVEFFFSECFFFFLLKLKDCVYILFYFF